MIKVFQQFLCKKLLFYGSIFGFLVFSYTILKDMQSVIFTASIGVTSVPQAKMFTTIILVPLSMLYAFVIKKIRNKHQLVYLYSSIFGFTTLFFGTILFFIDIQNLPSLLAWLFYIYIDTFPAFLLGVAWAFTTYNHTPQEAVSRYALMVAMSKFGGVLGAGFCVVFFTYCQTHLNYKIAMAVPILLSALSIFGVNILIRQGKNIFYQSQPLASGPVDIKAKKVDFSINNLLIGLKLILKNPYILSIFVLILSYEVLNQVINYKRLVINNTITHNVVDSGLNLFLQTLSMQTIGLFFAIFGGQAMFSFLGLRFCLIITPLLCISLILYEIFTQSNLSITIAYVGLHILNYTMCAPSRENLFTVTVPEAQFQAKSWMDAFGTKFSKLIGQNINILGIVFGSSAILWPIFGLIFISWMYCSVWLGKKYNNCIRNNIKIG